MTWILWTWFGCPKPPALVAPPAPAPVAAPATDRTPILGPKYWSEPGGLCLEVPEGFSGTTGPPPLLLDLVQIDTGFGFQIRVGAAEAELPPRPGFSVLFDSPGGSYRSVPILAPGAISRSWIAEGPDGTVVRTWSNRLGERMVEVAAVYPQGRVTEGTDALEPVLESVCRTTIDLIEVPPTAPAP